MAIFMIAATLLLLHTKTEAQNFTVKNSKVTVQGSSSLHDWESEVEKTDIKGSYTADKGTLVDLSNAVVKIPVTSIKSTKGKMMDNKTYEAFDFEKNPSIIFTVTSSRVGAKTVDFKGTLAMAGAVRPVEVRATWRLLSNGDLQVTGSHQLKMTDFKMEPPTAMMGTVKVGEEVTVTFDIVLSNIKSNL